MDGCEFKSPDCPPFRVFSPAEQRVPFVFNSPHSGRIYPQSLIDATTLTPHQLRRSEDVLVDELFADVVAIGAPLLAAQFPRAWLDVNREPYELDPLLFRERLPGHANSRSMRVAGGLGTIARLVAEGVPIYGTPPLLEDALLRIETHYRPYHETLRSLMGESIARFGYSVLVDCHSMPSTGARCEDGARADIILGDRYGSSCNPAITAELQYRFSQLGYSVAVNKPYAGGFITEHYGRPERGLHAVQVEINRALYVNEKTLEPTTGFVELRRNLHQVMAHLVSLPDNRLYPLADAAE